MIRLLQFNSEAELFDQTAALCISALRKRLVNGPASLVVSGGSTPKPLFERLSNTKLNWSDVTILPSDERWLPAEHEASNERLIRENLQQNYADGASVLGFKTSHDSAFEAETVLGEKLKSLPAPHAVTVVGMGPDAHFASLFPGTPQLESGLEINNEAPCIAVDATGCYVAGNYTERMSLTLSEILNSDEIILLFKGADKLAIIDKVLQDALHTPELPISYLLQQEKTPVTVCCC